MLCVSFWQAAKQTNTITAQLAAMTGAAEALYGKRAVAARGDGGGDQGGGSDAAAAPAMDAASIKEREDAQRAREALAQLLSVPVDKVDEFLKRLAARASTSDALPVVASVAAVVEESDASTLADPQDLR